MGLAKLAGKLASAGNPAATFRNCLLDAKNSLYTDAGLVESTFVEIQLLFAMKNLVVVGVQWGDEGKGKIVDLLAERFDVIARFGGGHNAGHTVKIGPAKEQKFVLQLIPCGILRPGKKAVIGNGLVVDPAALQAEIAALAKGGIDVQGRLFVSNRAHVIFPYHRMMEKAAETGSAWRTCSTKMRSTSKSSVPWRRRTPSRRS